MHACIILQPHHITVLPMHSEPDQVGAEDYLKLSFICLVLCSFHLNLPALFCVLPALAYSIKVGLYICLQHSILQL